MKKLCCETGSQFICGGPGAWDFGDNNPAILYCPWCGQKLPESRAVNWEVVVRFDRGLGAEFKKYTVEAETLAAAKSAGESLAAADLQGQKFKLLGSQASLIKA